jgi:hypothetical protein
MGSIPERYMDDIFEMKKRSRGKESIPAVLNRYARCFESIDATTFPVSWKRNQCRDGKPVEKKAGSLKYGSLWCNTGFDKLSQRGR